jgi:hypothetical protein
VGLADRRRRFKSGNADSRHIPIDECSAEFVPHESVGHAAKLEHRLDSSFGIARAVAIVESCGLVKVGELVGSVHDLLNVIADASQRGAWRAEGTTQILEADMGRSMGVDVFGNATTWIRVLVDGAGNVVAAYPLGK